MANEGLGWDPGILKMYFFPGGDWHPWEEGQPKVLMMMMMMMMMMMTMMMMMMMMRYPDSDDDCTCNYVFLNDIIISFQLSLLKTIHCISL